MKYYPLPVDLVLDVTVVWRLSELGVGGQRAVHHDRQQQPDEHLQPAAELGHQHLPQNQFMTVHVCRLYTRTAPPAAPWGRGPAWSGRRPGWAGRAAGWPAGAASPSWRPPSPPCRSWRCRCPPGTCYSIACKIEGAQINYVTRDFTLYNVHQYE